MLALTKPITVNGFVNLGAALKTAGYKGTSTPRILLIDNPSAATPVYLHLTDTNSSAGLTGTDGIPLSAAAFPARRNMELVAGDMMGLVDLNNIWLFTGASIPVTVAVAGV